MAGGELTVRAPVGLPDERETPAGRARRAAGRRLIFFRRRRAGRPGGLLRRLAYSFGWMAPSMTYTVPLPAVIGSPITLMSLTYSAPSVPV